MDTTSVCPHCGQTVDRYRDPRHNAHSQCEINSVQRRVAKLGYARAYCVSIGVLTRLGIPFVHGCVGLVGVRTFEWGTYVPPSVARVVQLALHLSDSQLYETVLCMAYKSEAFSDAVVGIAWLMHGGSVTQPAAGWKHFSVLVRDLVDTWKG